MDGEEQQRKKRRKVRRPPRVRAQLHPANLAEIEAAQAQRRRPGGVLGEGEYVALKSGYSASSEENQKQQKQQQQLHDEAVTETEQPYETQVAALPFHLEGIEIVYDRVPPPPSFGVYSSGELK